VYVKKSWSELRKLFDDVADVDKTFLISES
jgi:hypothetical protein